MQTPSSAFKKYERYLPGLSRNTNFEYMEHIGELLVRLDAAVERGCHGGDMTLLSEAVNGMRSMFAHQIKQNELLSLNCACIHKMYQENKTLYEMVVRAERASSDNLRRELNACSTKGERVDYLRPKGILKPTATRLVKGPHQVGQVSAAPFRSGTPAKKLRVVPFLSPVKAENTSPNVESPSVRKLKDVMRPGVYWASPVERSNPRNKYSTP